MFKKEMQAKLKTIFGIEKVTFDEPSESFEQDCIFIEILDCKSNTGQGIATSKVRGNLSIYSQKGKLPFGFFNKKIQQADSKDTGAFFFYDVDVELQNSQSRLIDIAERRASFVYLYSGQYDPNQGQITSLEFDE